MTLIEEARGLLAGAGRIAVLTGAGISAESGIPTFRGAGGLWRTYRPEDLATPEAFAKNPQLVWEWYMWRRSLISKAEPNPGHRALVELERRTPVFTLITQNVDGLHDRAGSKNVRKIHGDIWISRCTVCSYRRVDKGIAADGIPLCPGCASPLRPGVVWFGEPLPHPEWDDAERAVNHCQVLIVAGTSARVFPAAGLIGQARVPVIEVNLDDTPFSASVAVSLRGLCGELLPRLI